MNAHDLRLTSLAHGGGCGCKLAPSVLQQLLAEQPAAGPFAQLLVGTETSMQASFGSSCHGAGRTMSRSKAKKSVWGSDLRRQLEADGIVVRAGSMAGLAEEAPVAYKDVDMVVDVVHKAGLAHKVARLRPLGVMKG